MITHLVKKYEFENVADYEALKETYASTEHTIVELGHIEEADNFSVDVLCVNLEAQPDDWAPYELSLDNDGVHIFDGVPYIIE